jgi:hypothetical protein
MSGRHLGATLLGIVAGAAACTVLLLAGYLLYRRVWGDSVPALIGVGVLFGAAGLYGGWLLGVLVFSAVRGSGSDGSVA